MRRRAILLAVWVAGTLMATTLAWSAVSLVAERVTDQPGTATADLVVADGGSTLPTTTGPDGSTSSTAPMQQTAIAEGGQATFTCDGDRPALLDASPNLGWQRDTRAPVNEVWFDHDGDDSAIAARCDDGVPRLEVHEEDYDETPDDDDEGEGTTTTALPATAPPASGTTADDHGDDDGSATTVDDHGGDDDGGDEPDDDEQDDEPDDGDEPDDDGRAEDD